MTRGTGKCGPCACLNKQKSLANVQAAKAFAHSRGVAPTRGTIICCTTRLYILSLNCFYYSLGWWGTELFNRGGFLLDGSFLLDGGVLLGRFVILCGSEGVGRHYGVDQAELDGSLLLDSAVLLFGSLIFGHYGVGGYHGVGR